MFDDTNVNSLALHAKKLQVESFIQDAVSKVCIFPYASLLSLISK